MKVYGDYGLNIYNREAIAWAKDTGLTDYVLSHEVYKNIEPGEDGNQKCTFVGMIPLMVSEHDFAEKAFIDRKNKKFIVLQDAFEQKYMVVNMNENVENSVHKVVEAPQAKRIRIYFN